MGGQNRGGRNRGNQDRENDRWGSNPGRQQGSQQWQRGGHV